MVTTSSDVKASLTQQIGFVTYGLGERFDASLAVPFVIADLSVDLGRHDPAPRHRHRTRSSHYYDDGGGSLGSTREYCASGRASGIGDLTLRVKGQAASWGSGNGLALALDVRMPTGDEEDLLGSGAWGVRPFVATSFGLGVVSPHVNLGYQWNGSSLLAGNVLDRRVGRPGRRARLRRRAPTWRWAGA